jgi:hypothetical protein
MSDVLSSDDLAVLAAEYVLGTLDFEERKGATALLEVDHVFRARVRIWEHRLGELHLMVEPVEPDAQVLESIKTKIESLAPGITFAPPLAAEQSESQAEPAAEATSESEAPAAPEPSADAPAEAGDRPEKSESETAEPAVAAPIGADATANLIRELEEAAKLVPAAPDTTAAATALSPVQRGEVVEGAVEVPRPLRRWRLLAITMSLIAVMLAGLIGAWRFIPDRLPVQLQAATVLHLPVPEPPTPPPLPPPRREPPPSFDE